MAKLTKRSYKRKRVVVGIALFMSIALISSGFATWVISSQSKDEVPGGVEAGIISDKTVKVTLTKNEDGKLGTFSFDTLKTDTTGRVRYGNDEKFEQLTVTVAGSVTNPEYLGSLTVKLVELDNDGKEIATAAATRIQAAVNKNYIVAPSCFYNDVEIYKTGEGYESAGFTMNSEKTLGTFSYNITFAWGSAFHSDNPGIYYDTQYADDTENTQGINVADETMVSTLVDLRDVITGTKSTFNTTTGKWEQDTNIVGTQYKVIVTARSN